jgi:hypothetical protein
MAIRRLYLLKNGPMMTFSIIFLSQSIEIKATMNYLYIAAAGFATRAFIANLIMIALTTDHEITLPAMVEQIGGTFWAETGFKLTIRCFTKSYMFRTHLCITICAMYHVAYRTDCTII